MWVASNVRWSGVRLITVGFVPSPQSTETVWLSSVPGSVIVPSTVTDCPSLMWVEL